MTMVSVDGVFWKWGIAAIFRFNNLHVLTGCCVCGVLDGIGHFAGSDGQLG